MPEPTNVSALARSAESPTAVRRPEPEPEIRLTNPTKASEAAGFNMRSSRETGGAGRFPLQTAFGLLLGIAVLYLGRGVLIPIALALLLSFFLSPAMVRLQRWGLGKTFAALLVVGFSFSALVLVCWAELGQAYNLSGSGAV